MNVKLTYVGGTSEVFTVPDAAIVTLCLQSKQETETNGLQAQWEARKKKVVTRVEND